MGMVRMVAEGGIPGEICAYLLHPSRLVSHTIHSLLPLYWVTHINRKLAAHPHQLGSISLELPDAAGVRLDGIDGIFPQLVDDLEVAGEGAGVLVVFGGDVGLDGVGELDGVGAAEGDLEDVAALHLCYWRQYSEAMKVQDGVFSKANRSLLKVFTSAGQAGRIMWRSLHRLESCLFGVKHGSG